MPNVRDSPSRVEMLDYLGESTSSERDLYRIDFRFARHRADQQPDPRAAHSGEEFEAIDRALDLRDRKGKHGPWTRATLELIATHPGMASARMARTLRCDQLVLKQDVRKLKKLGLTISLETGYRLSPRGRVLRGPSRLGRGSAQSTEAARIRLI